MKVHDVKGIAINETLIELELPNNSTVIIPFSRVGKITYSGDREYPSTIDVYTLDNEVYRWKSTDGVLVMLDI